MSQTPLPSMSAPSHPSLRPPLRSDAAQSQRQLLRNELDVLWAAIAVKQAQLNALAPISYLPPEILGKIFYHISHGDIPRLFCWVDQELGFRPNQDKTYRSLINVTHVCSHWRQVAIQNPTLWTCPPLELGTKLMEILLLRSGSAPLVVEAHGDGPVLRPEMIQPLHEHLPHVESLHISSSHDIFSQLFPKLTQPARMLVSLILDRPPKLTSPDSRIVSLLPQDLFAGETPKLRRLALINCIAPWDCTIFRNLVGLHVNISGTGPLLFAVNGHLAPLSSTELLPSMSQLLEVLKANPMLESLGLREILPRASSHRRTPMSHIVNLPYLNDLSLVGTAQDCAALLSHISLPTSARLCFDPPADTTGSTEADCTALLDALEEHLRRTYSENDDISSEYVSYNSFGPELEIETELSHIMLRVSMDFDAYTDFLRRYFTIVPLAESVSLKFDDVDLLAFRQLMDIFAHEHLQCIDSVTINSGRAEDFCDALCVRGAAPDSEFLVFRDLTNLQFENFDFRDFPHLASFQRSLISLLQERAKHDSPIDRVAFSRCRGLNHAWCNALRVVDATEIWLSEDNDMESASP